MEPCYFYMTRQYLNMKHEPIMSKNRYETKEDRDEVLIAASLLLVLRRDGRREVNVRE